MKDTDSLPLSWLKDIAADQALAFLYQAALLQNLPVALWRLPAQSTRHLLIDLSGEATPVHPEVESLPSGFLFTPYEADLTAPDAEELKQALLLQADIHFSTEEGLQLAPGLASDKTEQAASLLYEAARLKDSSPATVPYFTNPHTVVSGTEKEGYCRLVERSIREIESGRLQKVVCARKKVLQLQEGFSPLTYFNRLCEAYPNAFVSFVSIPEIGSWIGATPETLISIDQHKLFRTMSLAGTQPKSAASSPADAVWRQKEIEEQALVSRYIINCFKKIRLREFEENGPRTVVAGNLMHLRTDFTVDMQQTGFPDLGSQMLSLLHPTSAVCGMPRAEAKIFLSEQEALDRQFYAGFLGPVHIQDEVCLFVNLRCMQLFGKEAMLYAGAGITADSDPEKEWQETEHKCATLAGLLQP